MTPSLQNRHTTMAAKHPSLHVFALFAMIACMAAITDGNSTSKSVPLLTKSELLEDKTSIKTPSPKKESRHKIGDKITNQIASKYLESKRHHDTTTKQKFDSGFGNLKNNLKGKTKVGRQFFDNIGSVDKSNVPHKSLSLSLSEFIIKQRRSSVIGNNTPGKKLAIIQENKIALQPVNRDAIVKNGNAIVSENSINDKTQEFHRRLIVSSFEKRNNANRHTNLRSTTRNDHIWSLFSESTHIKDVNSNSEFIDDTSNNTHSKDQTLISLSKRSIDSQNPLSSQPSNQFQNITIAAMLPNIRHLLFTVQKVRPAIDIAVEKVNPWFKNYAMQIAVDIRDSQ